MGPLKVYSIIADPPFPYNFVVGPPKGMLLVFAQFLGALEFAVLTEVLNEASFLNLAQQC